MSDFERGELVELVNQKRTDLEVELFLFDDHADTTSVKIAPRTIGMVLDTKMVSDPFEPPRKDGSHRMWVEVRVVAGEHVGWVSDWNIGHLGQAAERR